MYYVYPLETFATPQKALRNFPEDLRTRLREHNAGIRSMSCVAVVPKVQRSPILPAVWLFFPTGGFADLHLPNGRSQRLQARLQLMPPSSIGHARPWWWSGWYSGYPPQHRLANTACLARDLIQLIYINDGYHPGKPAIAETQSLSPPSAHPGLERRRERLAHESGKSVAGQRRPSRPDEEYWLGIRRVRPRRQSHQPQLRQRQPAPLGPGDGPVLDGDEHDPSCPVDDSSTPGKMVRRRLAAMLGCRTEGGLTRNTSESLRSPRWA